MLIYSQGRCIYYFLFFQVGKWICAQSSKAPKANLNEHITAKLEVKLKVMRTIYVESFFLFPPNAQECMHVHMNTLFNFEYHDLCFTLS